MSTRKFVYGMFLCGHDGKLALISLQLPLWTLPGGEVQPDDPSPADALRRLIYEQIGCGSEVIRSIGPLHTFADGSEATAYEVVFDNSFVTGDNVRMVSRGDVHQSPLAEPALARMVWDGFSVMEAFRDETSDVPPEMLPIEEGIYVNPAARHVLVEDYLQDGAARCRIWDRLDPMSETGKMQPN